MKLESGFSEETLRKIASQKVTFRYSVKIHLICYVSGNLLLFLINVLVSPDYWWAFYPLFGWLIGLAIHAAAYFTWSRGISYGKRAIIFNVIAWALSILLLGFTDLMTSGGFSWVQYPVFFWGLGIVVHIVFYYLITSRGRGSTEGPSKKELAIERELQKMKKKLQSESDK
ncbi:MAG: 2TM domain-containing protein [Candidatus Helarchaeota archaeon]